MVVTEHGEDRFSKRTGLSKKLAHNVAGKALEHGLRHGQTVGSLRRYLDGLYMSRYQLKAGVDDIKKAKWYLDKLLQFKAKTPS